jgi:hypothetical protein
MFFLFVCVIFMVDLVVKNQDLFLSVEEPQVFNKQGSRLLPLHTLFDPKQYI